MGCNYEQVKIKYIIIEKKRKEERENWDYFQ